MAQGKTHRITNNQEKDPQIQIIQRALLHLNIPIAVLHRVVRAADVHTLAAVGKLLINRASPFGSAAAAEPSLGSQPMVSTSRWLGTALTPSRHSPGGWCLKQKCCHSHEIKSCLCCWEALRHSGLNNSLVRQK